MTEVIVFTLQDKIEGYTNTVDDKSVQVGGRQRIITIDGYSMPLVCKGGTKKHFQSKTCQFQRHRKRRDCLPHTQ